MSGIDAGQLKHLVVAPALAALGLDGEVAVNLVTGTALAESRGTYVRQIGGGPALGLWQMEPATHDDCWVNFLCYPVGKRFERILQGMLSQDLPRSAQLVSNLRYASAMARIRYYRVSAPLPSTSDPAALSRFHKQYYNTAAGAADPLSNIPYFRQAVMV
ncbi:hypothetical protein AD929_04800 [Gluconobacter potus]|uniref:Phage tail lysozyme domain-containing protein n=2 Tax=Gluconobacter TaxID=441 RepID=A0A829WJZ0_GLUOY|nr:MULTISPECIES: hypothetical protein [Gluconobacter]KXV01777.1 hypothetical protein AD929_04800 [Gluconobacter potus]MBF0850722.1 hypothetical protein [Gluconobacter sp. R75690]MBF0879414.1 hypothetical protein [Gluconobacter sp. R75828]GEM15525.1 hypothetical protein NBRC3293_0022 [Gluconobacter oxydans NBRC 3293]